MVERQAGRITVITMLMFVEHQLGDRINDYFPSVNIFNDHKYLMR